MSNPNGRARTLHITLTSAQDAALQTLATGPMLTPTQRRVALRAQLVLAYAAGARLIDLAAQYQLSVNAVRWWLVRYVREGLAGLTEKRREALTPAQKKKASWLWRK